MGRGRLTRCALCARVTPDDGDQLHACALCSDDVRRLVKLYHLVLQERPSANPNWTVADMMEALYAHVKRLENK